MTHDRHDRKQQEKLQRRRQRRAQRPAPAAGLGTAETIQFPGIMGWMQRNTKWLFLGGIVILLLSLGAGTFFSTNNNTRPAKSTPTPTPTATASATPSATASLTPTPQRSYSSPPAMTINTAKKYQAVILLAAGGEITLELLPNDAPKTVNNFVFLARAHFYDGLSFHRVIPGFVAQGGDPSGTGSGGPGYYLEEEKNSVPLSAGVISMAKSPAGISGSQFFITYAPQPGLVSQGFIAFGRVTAGMEVLQRITPRDPQKPNQPKGDVIESITIVEKD